MTTQEWESRMDELRDTQLVTQRLMELNERKWNVRFEEMNSVMNNMATHSERHDQEIAELRSAMASLIQHIDRFIQGRQSNGH